jgi:ParB-like nuclease domain
MFKATGAATLEGFFSEKPPSAQRPLAACEGICGAAQERRNDPLPQLELVSIALDDLHLPERKTRKCTPAHVREVVGSISELGFCDPILVGQNNMVLDGEIRVEAAKALGLAAVPCIRIDHLTEVEQRRLRLALILIG